MCPPGWFRILFFLGLWPTSEQWIHRLSLGNSIPHTISSTRYPVTDESQVFYCLSALLCNLSGIAKKEQKRAAVDGECGKLICDWNGKVWTHLLFREGLQRMMVIHRSVIGFFWVRIIDLDNN